MITLMSNNDINIQDAASGNWVARFAPEWAQPYMQLARFDRPIGGWLLMWPCFWSVAMAGGYHVWAFFPLFLIGAFVMRGAGCTYNDILDRNFDAGVARTRNRPIPAGRVSVRAAAVFMIALSLTGLIILLQFNPFTIWLGVGSLALVAIYPLMKRVTYWPQLFLGLAFSWGALMGWSAVTGGLAPAAFALYPGSIFWVVGYDTIYALQDSEDDAIIGIKSTARKFGRDRVKLAVSLLYGAAITLFTLAGWLAETGILYYAGLAVLAAHLIWQVTHLDIDNVADCLKTFRSNHMAGAILFAATLTGNWL